MALGLLFLVIGGVMGWILGSNYMQSQGQLISGTVPGIGGGPGEVVQETSKASDFRVKVSSAIHEHAVVTGDYLKAIIDGKDTTALKSALDKNTNNITGIFENLYGNKVTSDFLPMWNDHINQYVAYAKAVKIGDEKSKNRAKDNLGVMVDQMQNSIQNLDPKISAGQFADYMREHVAGTLLLIDAHAVKNDSQVAQLETNNFDQAGRFADYITQVIVSHDPNSFK